MNSAVFSEELDYIADAQLRQIVREYFYMEVKPYFYEVPASTSGRYHPQIDLGKGGLVRHTRMCVRVAVELLQLKMWSKMDPDLCVAALLIHDSQKCGDGGTHTVHEHPALASEKFLKHAMKYPQWSELSDKVNAICRMVHSHMGQWNTSNYSNVVLPIPAQPDEKFVHLCDFIASRKFIGNYDYEL